MGSVGWKSPVMTEALAVLYNSYTPPPLVDITHEAPVQVAWPIHDTDPWSSHRELVINFGHLRASEIAQAAGSFSTVQLTSHESSPSASSEKHNVDQQIGNRSKASSRRYLTFVRSVGYERVRNEFMLSLAWSVKR